MRVIVDFDTATVSVEDQNSLTTYPLASAAGFAAASKAWIRAGWDAKHVYSFTWFGRPIIQLPEDMIRLAEVIYRLKPDVVIETGIAHGGSLVFYASLFKAMGQGRVIGIDIDIRSHNRHAMEAHELYPLIKMFEGSSIAPEIVTAVKAEIKQGEKILILLDSNHSQTHVQAELEAYAPLISKGFYIVVCDGIMQEVVGAPRSEPDWKWNNPQSAVHEFLACHPEFVLSYPQWEFNEGLVDQPITYWPNAWLRRI
jgi:cephalosporin hydroxylase